MRGKKDHDSLRYKVFKRKKRIKGNNIPLDNKSTPDMPTNEMKTIYSKVAKTLGK